MLARVGCVTAVLMLGACSLIGGGRLADDTPGVIQSGSLSPAGAQAAVHPGSSSKSDVMAALGRATVVSFGSGWEVWVYRWPGATRSTASATEVVVLFDPAGVARKVRVRTPA